MRCLRRWMCGLPLFLLCGCLSCEAPPNHHLFFTTVEELREFLAWSPEKAPLISAHRGGALPGLPENSLPACENTLKMTPAIIEIDVRRAKDGELFLMHDETLERTTNGRGLLKDYTAMELREFFLKDTDGNLTHYRIPTLAEVLEWARGKAILTLDIKDTPEEEIVPFLTRHQAESYVIVIAYTFDVALRCYQLNPKLMISAPGVGMAAIQQLLNSPIDKRSLLVYVGTSEPPGETYQLLHAQGIRTILVTVGHLDRTAARLGKQVYVDLLRNGADVLATDNIMLAAEAIKVFQQERTAERNPITEAIP